MKLPKPYSPVEWGAPEKFDAWRPGQFEAIIKALREPKRFIATVAPTGFGKTLYYVMYAHFTGERVAIVTKSKALQQQLMADFGDQMAFVNIMGKSNYPCDKYGDCERGHAAKCKNAGTDKCSYSRTEQEAMQSQFVVTNYTYWILKHKYGTGLGRFGLLVLDEGHEAVEELASALQSSISFQDLFDRLHVEPPINSEKDIFGWREWARLIFPVAESHLQVCQARCTGQSVLSPKHIRDYVTAKNLVRKVGLLASMDPLDWIVSAHSWGFQFDVIQPGKYAEDWLFLGVPKVMITSATMRPKTLEYLGLKGKLADDPKRRAYAFHQYPSTFPAERFPSYYVKTQRVDSKTTDFRPWVARVDQIVKGRTDRNGVVHTVSYDRRDLLMIKSRFNDRMITNYRGDVTADVIEDFGRKQRGHVLVSPSVTAGFDFAYTLCEYQIAGKVPFPDTRSKIVRARQDLDPEYGPYIAVQSLEQARGRGKRAADDQCEFFIIDDHFAWFVRKYRHLFTKEFLDSFRGHMGVPVPQAPPRLNMRRRR